MTPNLHVLATHIVYWQDGNLKVYLLHNTTVTDKKSGEVHKLTDPERN